MARGQEVKQIIGNLIIDALGDRFITVQDKKIFCQAEEGGEMVQVAISMTVPKTPITVQEGNDGPTPVAPPPQTTLSEADQKKINELCDMLGIERN